MEISGWIAHGDAWSPEKTALRFHGREMTYSQLEAYVERLQAVSEKFNQEIVGPPLG